MRIKATVLALLAVTAGVFAYTRPHKGIPSDLRDAVADSREFTTNIPVFEKGRNDIPEPKVKTVEAVSDSGLTALQYSYSKMVPSPLTLKIADVGSSYCLIATLSRPTPPITEIVAWLSSQGIDAGACVGSDSCLIAMAKKDKYEKTVADLESFDFVASVSKNRNIVLAKFHDRVPLPPLKLIERNFLLEGIKFIPFKWKGAYYAAVIPGADIRQTIMRLASLDFIGSIGINDVNHKAALAAR